MLHSLGRGLTCAATNTSSQLPPTASVDSAIKTVALIGDSITSQNDSSNKQEFTSQGYMTWLNALTGQRYYYDPAYNLGDSGQSIATTRANMTNLAILSPTPDLIFYIPFANDITGSRSYADLIADLDAIIAYVTGTLGAKMVIGTPLPRTQDNGNALTTSQQTLSNNLRGYIMNLSVNGVTPINIYDNMTSTGDNPDTYLFDDEGGKYLHPTPAGAHQIAVDMKAALDPVFGSNAIPDMSICDLGLNSDLSGTGGTESSPLTSAQVADKWRFYSYSGLSGVVTKTAADYQSINVSYTNSRSFDLWELQATDITSGFALGDDYYMEAEIEIISSANMRTAACIEPTLNGSGSFKAMSPYDVNAWPIGFSGTLHLRTPIFKISSSDNIIDPIIWGQMNSLGVTSNDHILIKAARMVKMN